MIEYIEIDGQRAKIANQKFPNYFSVDSMAVLIGENGSGKTRLLLNVAEALTTGSQIADQGHWRGWDTNGMPVGGDTKNPLPGLGVLYYTPLPYRRRITPHAQYFDASSSGANLSRSRSYRQYQFIAHSLGVDTRLIGRISYRKDLFRRLIVPRILEADCLLMDPILESQRLNLASKQNRSATDKSFENDVDNFAKSIESWIYNAFEFTDYEYIVALACLEYTTTKLSQRFLAVQAFLDIIGIAKLNEPYNEDRAFGISEAIKRFDRIYVTTVTFLEGSRYKDSRPIENNEHVGYEVEIDYIGSPRLIGSRAGAVQIVWENLSSGLFSLVEQFTRLEQGLEKLRRRGLKSVLILIDEGDAYLHLEWQRQYILHLDRFLEKIKKTLSFDSVQVLLATHSPIISGDFPSAMVQRLGPTSSDNFKTLGSSLDTLVLDTFGTTSIGEFAARKIMDLRAKFIAGELQSIDHELLNEIGDEGLRRAITSRVQRMA